MTDINKELGQIADETFVDDHELTEVAADAPKQGAGPAEPMSQTTVPGERQDMGPAVVSPDASSDPGKEASKKSKKSAALPDKGKPSDASPKAMGDGSGPMKAGAREEFTGDDDDEEIQAIAEGDDEDEAEEIVAEASGDDEEDETIEERVDRRVAAMDFSDDVRALTEGGDDDEEISAEFKSKAGTIFEAAVKSKVRTELEHIEEEYAQAFDAALDEIKDELTEQVDGYLQYAIQEWMKTNEVAVEHKLKTEIAEGFINGLKSLFQDHNIAVPDEQFDMLDAAAEQVGELEGKLNESIERNVELNKELGELKRNEILLDVASDLADTEVEKFAELAENVDYDGEKDFREKVETLKESYFPKTKPSSTNDDTAAPVISSDDVDVTDTMAAYMSAISRNAVRSGEQPGQ